VEERGDAAERDGAGRPRCRWCGRRLPPPSATGRPRRYCRRSCRQRAFEARRRLGELSWAEDRLREHRVTADERYVAFAALADLATELMADVEDQRAWDDATRDEHVQRLAALVEGLAPFLG